MHDTTSSPCPEEELILQALLYASGELEGAEAQEFEERLAEDQLTREALTRAVGLTLSTTPSPSLTPDPRYRRRVRDRLGFSSSPNWTILWSRLLSPVLWSLGGAVVAVSLILLLAPGTAPLTPTSATYPPLSVLPQGVFSFPEEDETPEVTRIWASLHDEGLPMNPSPGEPTPEAPSPETSTVPPTSLEDALPFFPLEEAE